MSDRTKIRFSAVDQIELFAGYVLIEDVKDDRKLDIPAEEELIVIAGTGTAKNPKNNKQSPGIYLVRLVGPGVEAVKPGNWVLLSWRAMVPDDPACLNNFYIKDGEFALCTEASLAAKVKSKKAIN